LSLATRIDTAARALRPPDPVVYRAVTRLLDVVLSVVALVLTAPLILIIWLVVAIDSPGPAIFRQQRVGSNGTPFTFHKFRTMYVDARERFPDLYRYAFSSGDVETMFFKLADDPRLTRFGRILRRTSLDELPNLLNVLAGHMTLVGPRPEIPEMLPYYRPEQLVKFSFKPGLTGLAQVSGRNILSFQQTLERDMEYAARRSLLFDALILVRTPVMVIKMVGAL
jgi:lipopolysaccharide/colanic/teichoic acid biosynthesis glycosyltransferase